MYVFNVVCIIGIPGVKCAKCIDDEHISMCVHNTGCGSRGKLLFQSIEICYDPLGPGKSSIHYIFSHIEKNR